MTRNNRSLEEKLATLSREPFIKGVYEQQEERAVFEETARERDELKKKFAILQVNVLLSLSMFPHFWGLSPAACLPTRAHCVSRTRGVRCCVVQESVRAHYTSLSALTTKAEELSREKSAADQRVEEVR